MCESGEVMSNACKCDRCGRYFDDETPVRVDVSKNVYKKYGHVKAWLIKNEWHLLNKKIWEKELCPECCDKLTLFLDGAELQTEIKNDGGRTAFAKAMLR